MNNLRLLRKQNNLSMKKLGQIVGVVESTISLYENGKREPDIATLIKLADFFGVTVDYLIGRENTEIIKRPLGDVAENFIKEYKDLFQDEAFVKFSKVYKHADINTRILAISYLFGYLQSNGINVNSII